MYIPSMPPRDDRPAGDRCEITLRDTFAAAALTGLLSQGDDGSFSEESYARGAYRWADAMLAQRLRNGAASGCEAVQSTLTDAERESVKYFLKGGPADVVADPKLFATLRGLLERLA